MPNLYKRIKLPKHSIIYRQTESDINQVILAEDPEIQADEPPACHIMLTVTEGDLEVFVEIDPDFAPEQIGALVGAVATAEIFGPILQEVTNCMGADDREAEMEIVEHVIKHRIDEHRQATLEEMGRKRPVVEPIGAINHLISMYGQASPVDE